MFGARNCKTYPIWILLILFIMLIFAKQILTSQYYSKNKIGVTNTYQYYYCLNFENYAKICKESIDNFNLEKFELTPSLKRIPSPEELKVGSYAYDDSKTTGLTEKNWINQGDLNGEGLKFEINQKNIDILEAKKSYVILDFLYFVKNQVTGNPNINLMYFSFFNSLVIILSITILITDRRVKIGTKTNLLMLLNILLILSISTQMLNRGMGITPVIRLVKQDENPSIDNISEFLKFTVFPLPEWSFYGPEPRNLFSFCALIGLVAIFSGGNFKWRAYLVSISLIHIPLGMFLITTLLFAKLIFGKMRKVEFINFTWSFILTIFPLLFLTSTTLNPITRVITVLSYVIFLLINSKRLVLPKIFSHYLGSTLIIISLIILVGIVLDEERLIYPIKILFQEIVGRFSIILFPLIIFFVFENITQKIKTYIK